MATIGDTVAAGRLVLFKPPDWEKRQPVRPLWATPELITWADTTQALHDPVLGMGQRTRFEHLLQMFCDFRCSRRLHAGDIKRVMPTKNGVWKMHPFGLRIYGWAPEPNEFAAVTWATVEETKVDKRLSDAKRKEVLAFLKANGLRYCVTYGDVANVFPNTN